MFLLEDTLLQGGKYKIVRFLSSGGFGNTYEGVHTMRRDRGQVSVLPIFLRLRARRGFSAGH